MALSCSVCHDIFIVTESCSSTLCGHLFHSSCLQKWLTENRNCPHCRSPCTFSTVHRVYLPEAQIERNEIMDKLTEVAIANQEKDKQIKDLEKNMKKVEYELKIKKKQYQKVLNRSRRIGKHSKTINIPRAGQSSVTSSTTTSATASSTIVASTSHNVNQPSSVVVIKSPRSSTQQQGRSKKIRNRTRKARAKEYFRRRKAFYNNNQTPIVNNNNNETATAGIGNVMTV